MNESEASELEFLRAKRQRQRAYQCEYGKRNRKLLKELKQQHAADWQAEQGCVRDHLSKLASEVARLSADLERIRSIACDNRQRLQACERSYTVRGQDSDGQGDDEYRPRYQSQNLPDLLSQAEMNG
jgi:hypothetical protein